MIDLTSSLYLGLHHGSGTLRPWRSLTTGKPAALLESPRAPAVECGLARLQGSEAAVVASSTFHLFWDLFQLLSQLPVSIFLDASAYPTTRWAASGAFLRGVRTYRFAHYSPESLRRRMEATTTRPLVVADGFCPECGRAAPVTKYLRLIQARRGLLVLDDTQALGILGRSGGGIARDSEAGRGNLILVSSLAKGFGAPLGVLTGPCEIVDRIRTGGPTRVHSSPPSAAALAAAQRALRINRSRGDSLRTALRSRVRRFRQVLDQVNISISGEVFPVHVLEPPPGRSALGLHRALLRRGIRGVVTSGAHATRRNKLTLILTTRHSPDEIEHAARSVAEVLRTSRSPSSRHRARRPIGAREITTSSI